MNKQDINERQRIKDLLMKHIDTCQDHINHIRAKIDSYTRDIAYMRGKLDLCRELMQDFAEEDDLDKLVRHNEKKEC